MFFRFRARAGGSQGDPVPPFVVRLLWPARCPACRGARDERAVFCESCATAAEGLLDVCPGCALPAGDHRQLCRPCRLRPFPFVRASAAFVYGGPVAEAIVRFKHGRDLAPARPLGRALAPVIAAAIRAGIHTIVPVPLHPRRLRSRGFNQAHELAVAGLAACGARGADPPAVILGGGLLRRQRDTPPLGRDGPVARRHQVAGAFVVPDRARVQGQRVLLLDDVMTTGATLAECALTLRTAGAAEIWVAALARAV
jgi:predicted amidophosphoribosyltransferase